VFGAQHALVFRLCVLRARSIERRKWPRRRTDGHERSDDSTSQPKRNALSESFNRSPNNEQSDPADTDEGCAIDYQIEHYRTPHTAQKTPAPNISAAEIPPASQSLVPLVRRAISLSSKGEMKMAARTK
jgi:hypothetical protein